MAKLSDVVVLEIPLFYPRFNLNEVNMEIVWKDTMFKDASNDTVKNNIERNEKILKVIEKEIGTFPKSFESYQVVLFELMNIPKEYKNIVIVLTYKEKIFIIMNSCRMTSEILDRAIELYSRQSDLKKEVEKVIKKKGSASILKKLL